MEIGLHRLVDDWDEFDPILVEVRKRTLWALYSQQVKACCSFGRPLLLHLRDIGMLNHRQRLWIDIDEPCAVEAVYSDRQWGPVPSDEACILGGCTAAIRLHMILERMWVWPKDKANVRIIRINMSARSEPAPGGFLSLVSAPPIQSTLSEELTLLTRVTDGLTGDWLFSSESINDPNDARFFEKTRIFALQHFCRLLMVRHEFSYLLERGGDAEIEMQRTARQITECECHRD